MCLALFAEGDRALVRERGPQACTLIAQLAADSRREWGARLGFLETSWAATTPTRMPSKPERGFIGVGIHEAEAPSRKKWQCPVVVAPRRCCVWHHRVIGLCCHSLSPPRLEHASHVTNCSCLTCCRWSFGCVSRRVGITRVVAMSMRVAAKRRRAKFIQRAADAAFVEAGGEPSSRGHSTTSCASQKRPFVHAPGPARCSRWMSKPLPTQWKTQISTAICNFLFTLEQAP